LKGWARKKNGGGTGITEYLKGAKERSHLKGGSLLEGGKGKRGEAKRGRGVDVEGGGISGVECFHAAI